ncbi:MAG: 1-aminocyclopropane-1-carboxylate deaminase [Flavobacteriales bacterium]|nr:1-aminocyclopropane-1-carboxylate deaminase [Flavobacteriales bacterium]|tara:strand:+ start:29 stop:916 length:888 start_codon:yes stop_codon:yes gene_type:complete
MKIKTQEISLPLLKDKKIRIFIKRLDQTHKHVSGNKWFKLKYNLIEAKKQGAKSILTFGGAYSNHIAATAYLAKEKGFSSIGIIRGEEHIPLNPTLKFAIKQNMKINYIDRHDYRLKHTSKFLQKLRLRFGKFYLIPEGGTNKLALKGTSEIIDGQDLQDYICCSVGTGGTIAGISNSIHRNQKVIGFPAIKGSDLLRRDIGEWTDRKNWDIITNYNCGGYAKLSKELVKLINNCHKTLNIPLDGIYTGKMMLGVIDLIRNDYFPKGSSILLIHTGGIQGNIGLNRRFGLQLPIN